MGFWKNTKLVITNTGKALSTSAELLASGAESFERSTRLMLLESKISSLERERARLRDDWFASSNIEKREQLDSFYEELFSEFPTEIPRHLKHSKLELDKNAKSNEVRRLSQQIAETEQRIEMMKNALAITKIKELRKLRTLLNVLKNNAFTNQDFKLGESVNRRLNQLDQQVEALESQRHLTVTDFDANGKKLVEYETFDGMNHGLYRAWYPSGEIHWDLSFSMGQPQTGQCFREDGSLLFDYEYHNSEVSEYVISSTDSLRLVKIRTNGRLLTIRLLVEQVRGIEFTKPIGKSASILKLLLKLTFSYRALRFVWRSRRDGDERRISEAFMSSSEEFRTELQALDKIIKAAKA